MPQNKRGSSRDFLPGLEKAGPSPCPATRPPSSKGEHVGGSGEGGGVRTHGGHTHVQKYTDTPQDLLITGENVHH